MKNVIVGTAGHVDHGKTCLIRALTGMETDRLKEEKKRGITIENGFADMIYGDYNISIIDVPGHERFIKNMLAGIGGIDIVLLVIGLDEGVMPQTVEHFQILKMLDIKKGIVVFNTPGANANAVKELVLAGMFLAARHIPRALSWAASLTEGVGAAVEKGKSQFAGTEIMGKTLGIAGLGAIGKKVAASAAALGMNIVGYDPFFNGQVPQGVAMYDSLEEMLPLCDYVTIHIPATDSTKGMFNKDLFACFKDCLLYTSPSPRD